MLRLGLRCLGGTRFTDLDLDHLRFFLHGESQLTYALYESRSCTRYSSAPLRGPGGPNLLYALPSACAQ